MKNRIRENQRVLLISTLLLLGTLNNLLANPNFNYPHGFERKAQEELAGHLVTNQTPLSNPDHDSLPNIVDYATGGSMSAYDPSPIILQPGSESNIITVMESAQALEVNLYVDISYDLVNWATHVLKRAEATEIPEGYQHTIEVAKGNQDTFFSRLRVEPIVRAPWMNGINLPWYNFGFDFGNHYQWGDAFSTSFFETSFAEFASKGINVVRIWIHCDGRSTPEFASPGGIVTGLDANFFEDFDEMLEAAAASNILIMPCLWSFDMAKPTPNAGIYAGTCRSLMEDDTVLDSYIKNALAPMIERYAEHPQIWAWEIINEPEWVVENHGVSVLDMQRFIGRLTAEIHRRCRQPVTTGAASLKWNSDAPEAGTIANWFSDEALMFAADGDPAARLDFYQIHYYDWMNPWYDPFAYDLEYFDLLDRPVIMGECYRGYSSQHTNESLTTEEMMERMLQNGYSGFFGWSYEKENQDNSTELIDAAEAFYQNHPEFWQSQ